MLPCVAIIALSVSLFGSDTFITGRIIGILRRQKYKKTLKLFLVKKTDTRQRRQISQKEFGRPEEVQKQWKRSRRQRGRKAADSTSRPTRLNGNAGRRVMRPPARRRQSGSVSAVQTREARLEMPHLPRRAASFRSTTTSTSTSARRRTNRRTSRNPPPGSRSAAAAARMVKVKVKVKAKKGTCWNRPKMMVSGKHAARWWRLPRHPGHYACCADEGTMALRGIDRDDDEQTVCVSVRHSVAPCSHRFTGTTPSPPRGRRPCPG